MTASQRTEQVAARAVHMIASIEPALDEAIERFARDEPELSQIPARMTVLRELRGVLEKVVDAENYVPLGYGHPRVRSPVGDLPFVYR